MRAADRQTPVPPVVFRRHDDGDCARHADNYAPGAGELHGSLSVLLWRLLAKAPADRYSTIADVRSDLRQASSSHVGSNAALVTGEVRTSLREMVGRDSERADLLRGLDGAMAGRGSIVFVGGEPGIGKTRLMQEL